MRRAGSSFAEVAVAIILSVVAVVAALGTYVALRPTPAQAQGDKVVHVARLLTRIDNHTSLYRHDDTTFQVVCYYIVTFSTPNNSSMSCVPYERQQVLPANGTYLKRGK